MLVHDLDEPTVYRWVFLPVWYEWELNTLSYLSRRSPSQVLVDSLFIGINAKLVGEKMFEAYLGETDASIGVCITMPDSLDKYLSKESKEKQVSKRDLIHYYIYNGLKYSELKQKGVN